MAGLPRMRVLRPDGELAQVQPGDVRMRCPGQGNNQTNLIRIPFLLILNRVLCIKNFFLENKFRGAAPLENTNIYDMTAITICFIFYSLIYVLSELIHRSKTILEDGFLDNFNPW